MVVGATLVVVVAGIVVVLVVVVVVVSGSVGGGSGTVVVVVAASVVVVASTVVVGASVVVVTFGRPYDQVYSGPGSPLRHARQSVQVGNLPASTCSWGWVIRQLDVFDSQQVNVRPPAALTCDPMKALSRVAAGIKRWRYWASLIFG